ncbi:MAG: ArnT family glycosyltransferase [Bacteroidota bacterium]
MKLHSVILSGAIVFFFSLFLFLFGSGNSPIYILDESKNAQCAYEMLTSGDGITPVFNGELRTDKPPLHYYCMMAAYSIMGKTPFAARFFSGIFGSILMLVLFLFVNQHSTKLHAWWSIFVLWASIHFIVEFHLAVPDPYLITFTGIGLMSFYHWMQTRKRWAIWGIYAMLGLGVLSKGPVAVALPGLAMLIYLLVTHQFSLGVLRKLFSFSGILIFLIIVIPWYYLVWKTTDGAWIEGFIVDHNINRFSDTKEGHGGFILLTAGYYLMGFLPFVFFIFPFVKTVWKSRTDSLMVFGSIITLVFVVFFSISKTQLPNYAMPAYPFTAILFGYFLSREAEKVYSVKFRWNFFAAFVFSLLLPIGVFIAIEIDPNLKGMHRLLFFLLPLVIGSLIATVLAFRGKNRIAFLTLGSAFCIGALTLIGGFMPQLSKRNPVYLSQSIVNTADSVAWHKDVNPAFIFKYGVIPELETTEEVASFLSKPGNVLLTTKKGISRLEDQVEYEILFKTTDLFDNRKTRIIKGHPEINQ